MPTTEELLALCYKCKLTAEDIDMMSYGDLIDYLDAYLELIKPDNEQKVRKATQADIDKFFG